MTPPSGPRAGFSERVMARVRNAVKRVLRETGLGMQRLATTLHERAVVEENFDETGDRLGINVRLLRSISSGRGPWDIKPGLLASPKAKVAKDGSRYIDVPLHTSYAHVESWRPRGPSDQAGEFSVSESGQYLPFEPGAAGRSGPIVFRRVSEKGSHPMSWIHPGFVSRGFGPTFQISAGRVTEMSNPALAGSSVSGVSFDSPGVSLAKPRRSGVWALLKRQAAGAAAALRGAPK